MHADAISMWVTGSRTIPFRLRVARATRNPCCTKYQADARPEPWESQAQDGISKPIRGRQSSSSKRRLRPFGKLISVFTPATTASKTFWMSRSTIATSLVKRETSFANPIVASPSFRPPPFVMDVLVSSAAPYLERRVFFSFWSPPAYPSKVPPGRRRSMSLPKRQKIKWRATFLDALR